MTAGLSYSSQTDDRLDINAINGSVTAAGVASPNRNEQDTASDFDEYAQGQLSVMDNVDLHAGIRNIHTILGVDPLASPALSNAAKIKAGGLQFIDTTPVIGVVWKLKPEVNIYANYGRGYQSPNLIQIAYNSLGNGSGPNLGLGASTSDNYEAGIKAFISENTQLNLAVFRIITNNEISLAGDTNSYAYYKNLPVSTSREGLELSVDSQLEHNFALYGAFSYMEAKFDGKFTEANSTTTFATVNSGNNLPGTYKNQLYGEVSWKYPELGFSAALEERVNGKVYANDSNNAAAPGYAITNLRAGFKQSIRQWQLSEYARIENLFDQNYISAVRVNDTNGEFYEAGAGRNYIAGLSASYRF
jgi:iron complex outermembrane receptor protein